MGAMTTQNAQRRTIRPLQPALDPQGRPIASWPVDVTLRLPDVLAAAKSRNGLTFKGFGVLSGNATSSLLFDYKTEQPEQYWRLLRVLFGGPDPLMTIVKIEMGNDRNTSTGPEPAVMRGPDEYPDVAREPGFQLAADARRFNPRLHTSILRWCHPVWVRSDYDHDRIYRWYKNTILAVYRRYGYMTDSVNPHINERPADLGWAREFARRVRTDETGFEGAGTVRDLSGGQVPAWSSPEEKRLFHRIQIIVSDEEATGTCGDQLTADKPTRDAVDIASYHYSTSDDEGRNYTRLADEFDKQVWNSEAQATFSLTADRPHATLDPASGEGPGQVDASGRPLFAGAGIGGINGPLEMANTIIRGFASSRRTAFIYQPAISAFYDGAQYSSKELVALHYPWDGYINWDGSLAVLRQFSAFCHAGFEDCTLPEVVPGAVPAREGEGTGPSHSGQETSRSNTAPIGTEGSDDGSDGRSDDRYVGDGVEKTDARGDGDRSVRADRPQRVWRVIPQATVCAIGDGRPPGLGDGPDSARGGAASCLTLAAPDGSDFSTVIVNDSRFARTYRLDVDPALLEGGDPERGTGDGSDTLDVWQTRGVTPQEQADARSGRPVRADGHYMRRLGIIRRGADGRFTVRVEPWSITTVTTLPADRVEKNRDLPGIVEPVGAVRVLGEDVSDAPAVSTVSAASAARGSETSPSDTGRSGSVLYSDDFEYTDMPPVTSFINGTLRKEAYLASRGGDTGAVPRYTMDTNGAFEVVRTPDALSGTHVLRQRVGQGTAGRAWVDSDPRTVIGDLRWADYDASVSVCFREEGYASLGVRQWGGTDSGDFTAYMRLAVCQSGDWVLRRYGRILASGRAPRFEAGLGRWNRLRIRVAGGRTEAFVNDARVALFDDLRPQLIGRLQLGSSFSIVDFEDLRVKKIDGTHPYCTDVIDDLHLTRWDDGSPVLGYFGPWQHLVGQGMYCFKRSLSTVGEAGSGLSVTINGTGLLLLGRGDGSARLHVDVDGRRLEAARPTWAADALQPVMFAVDGLPMGEREIRLTKADGRPLTLDAVAVLGPVWEK